MVSSFAKVKDRAKRLIRPREKFLVLEVMPGGTNALFMSVDEDRNIIFEKSVAGANLKKFLRSPLRTITQKSWEGEYIFKTHRKIIVAADPSLATTMPIPLDLSRERAQWNTEITLIELENLIAQAMAKIFTQCRKEASKRLGIDDIHTILVGAKTSHYKVDGRAVMNPIDFTSKKIALLLELTFTSREVFENLKQLFNSPDEFFFVEAPQAWLLSLSRSRHLPLNLITTQNADASLFVFQKADGEHPILYRETLSWSFGSIFKHITNELGVSNAIAQELYAMYRRGELSESAERRLRKIIQPAVDDLLKEITHAKLKGFIYSDSTHTLPFDLPYHYKGLTFEELPVNEILISLGLQGDIDMSPREMRKAFHHLAPFIEAYFAKNTSEINQKLRRRLHWLAE
jgi:hypothetical protein